MNFQSEYEKKLFINGVKYFLDVDNYCLGSTLYDAGEVIRMIIDAQNQGEKHE